MNEAIDLRQFRYFLAVSEEGNFGRAAARLHISQPPLSRQIRQLEDDLGVELLVRGKTGVTLTGAGAAFAVEARRTLAQAAKAIAVARAGRGAAGGKFVVGYTTVFDRSVIPGESGVFAELRRLYPELRIVTRGKHSISLVRDIKNGTMDAAFIGLHTEAQGLEAQTIHSEALLVALPAAHPLARKRRLGFDDLRDEPLFWFERRLNPGFYDHCQTYFAQIGFRPNVIPEPADHHIMLGLIAEGQGIALISASLRKVRRDGVVFRPLRDDSNGLSAGLSVAYSASNPSPVLRSFLDLVGVGKTATPAAANRS